MTHNTEENHMTYWVYEDDPTRIVRVHRAACTYCNYGHGSKGSRLQNNRWHGPFGTQQEAIDRAVSTGRHDVRGCRFCLPGLGDSGQE